MPYKKLHNATSALCEELFQNDLNRMLTHLALFSTRGLWEQAHTHTEAKRQKRSTLLMQIHTSAEHKSSLWWTGSGKQNMAVMYSLMELCKAQGKARTSFVMTMRPLSHRYLRQSFFIGPCKCVCPLTGHMRIVCSEGWTRAASEAMTPPCFTVALMCCLIRTTSSFFCSPWWVRCTAGGGHSAGHWLA